MNLEYYSFLLYKLRRRRLLASLKEIKKSFFSLSQKEQENILKEIYSFSKDVKEFMNVRLLGDGEEIFIEQMKKVTQSSTPSGTPKMIKVANVNSVLNKAKKSKVNEETLCTLQWYAFDGYITFLDDYGGGPESYENKADEHFKNYLLLLFKTSTNKKKLQEELYGIENYLNDHNNMNNEYLWEIYEEITFKNYSLFTNLIFYSTQ